MEKEVEAVKAWRETVVIPTYECGAYEKNPIFLEKRVYQGSSGVVYPYPVIESISDEKTDHEWHAVFMENEYIKVMILPELGGRVQMAYDKIKQRHFVYYNHVIKPALVGLAGPWISGGIEFNWPQHHRPSTYMPVDCTIEENEDGSVTVWCSEMERMFHQKGMAGFTLRPGCAFLEIKVKFYNRTDLPQTFLWWANPAVKVNDYYQSVFPQDINAVFDHGKRAVSTFPIATGTYYKMDYSAGVDISNYKNIKVPTSYMGVNSRFDFEGGYENDTKGGMLHVANHHVSPGKKQWTWGNGDFGRAWDRALTDDDGPYIELMAGVYTENQPDFSWIMPGEEKEFTQYFMPYRELGIVKQASKDLIMNLIPTPDPSPREERLVTLRLLATHKQEWHIVLRNDDGTIYHDEILTLSPEEVFEKDIDVKDTPLNKLTFSASKTNQPHLPCLIWHAESDDIKRVPDSAEAALLPEDTKTVEQLYLTGLHLEQYRHATWSPVDYYEEGLRRDPNDTRCLNQLGLWYLRRGRFECSATTGDAYTEGLKKAEPLLRKCVKILMKRNPNPYWGEPLYNLGLCLKYQSGSQIVNREASNGKLSEAYDWFYKATWNGAWQNQAYFACAQISVMQDRLEDALYETERAIRAGWHHHKARALRVAILRKLGRKDDALALSDESLKLDSFNYGCRYEKYLLTGDEKEMDTIKAMMRQSPLNWHELALDYAQAGLWQDCIDILRQADAVSPMTYYYIGWAEKMLGHDEAAQQAFAQAEATDSYCCFPNRLEDILALSCAISLPIGEGWGGASKASYYLGCLYYDKRQYDVAIDCWERSLRLDDKFPTVWRCLALAAFNKQHDKQKAVEYMERAYALDPTDARILMELDQLYKVLQRPYAERLALLQKHPTEVAQRDDLVLEEITLLNQVGRYEEAMEKLKNRQFHVWEGGEGKVSGQYQFCRVEIAKKSLTPSHSDYTRAIQLLKECLEFPHNLGEGKLYGAQDNDFYYLMGCAYEKMGNMDKARECWLKATEGPMEPAAAMYYNDAKPDKIFYAGLAWVKLGEQGKANGVFYRLITYGEKHIFDTVRMDYFAVSLPDLLIWDGDLQLQNTIHCKYMLALGYYGIGDKEKSERYLKEAERLNINHQGIQAFRSLTLTL